MMVKRKKYQLKYKDGTTLFVDAQFDTMYDIMKYITKYYDDDDLKRVSVWMDGVVLE